MFATHPNPLCPGRTTACLVGMLLLAACTTESSPGGQDTESSEETTASDGTPDDVEPETGAVDSSGGPPQGSESGDTSQTSQSTGDGSGDGSSGGESCSRAVIEAEIVSTLSAQDSITDFSVLVERADGVRLVSTHGTSSILTRYESASTSKMVTAAVVLWLVERGDMTLDDTPSQYLPTGVWDLAPDDPLQAITLAHLLSFTSGLTEEPLCINLPGYDFETCVANIAAASAGNTIEPGSQFYYSGTHLQVAGAMAVRATHSAGWSELFEAFKAETGLFATSVYDLPSLSNPRLAGGMTWTAEEYVEFLRAYKDAEFSDSFVLASEDHVGDAVIAQSPVTNANGEAWHYGFGMWLECRSPVFDCESIPYVSSAGAYGAYPFVNVESNFVGLLAQQGSLGTGIVGVQVIDLVRPQLEAWAQCDAP